MVQDQFINDFNKAKEEIPFLSYKYDENLKYCHIVKGDFEIIDHEENHWGTFSASLYFPFTYPKGFALLKDESKVFPWCLDWHIDKDSGLCCVCGPIENAEQSAAGITVNGFINDYVIPFYANQIFKREFGYYKNGEYGHFEDGIWEALEEEFNVSEKKEIVRMLNQMKTKRGRNQICFCGSGKKFKRCHLNRIKILSKVAQSIL